MKVKGGNYENVIALTLASVPHCVLAHDVRELT